MIRQYLLEFPIYSDDCEDVPEDDDENYDPIQDSDEGTAYEIDDISWAENSQEIG